MTADKLQQRVISRLRDEVERLTCDLEMAIRAGRELYQEHQTLIARLETALIENAKLREQIGGK